VKSLTGSVRTPTAGLLARSKETPSPDLHAAVRQPGAAWAPEAAACGKKRSTRRSCSRDSSAEAPLGLASAAVSTHAPTAR
jgi:hypothetical protein